MYLRSILVDNSVDVYTKFVVRRKTPKYRFKKWKAHWL